ncbi:uncharacterized protein M437DRAFT_68679, partial [Aureobasidium melanogenum CBS 110374]
PPASPVHDVTGHASPLIAGASPPTSPVIKGSALASPIAGASPPASPVHDVTGHASPLIAGASPPASPLITGAAPPSLTVAAPVPGATSSPAPTQATVATKENKSRLAPHRKLLAQRASNEMNTEASPFVPAGSASAQPGLAIDTSSTSTQPTASAGGPQPTASAGGPQPPSVMTATTIDKGKGIDKGESGESADQKDKTIKRLSDRVAFLEGQLNDARTGPSVPSDDGRLRNVLTALRQYDLDHRACNDCSINFNSQFRGVVDDINYPELILICNKCGNEKCRWNC